MDTDTATELEPNFYSLPAELVKIGMSTDDGQDVVNVNNDGTWVSIEVYTPRPDDPEQDAENRNETETRMHKVGEPVNLAAFEDSEIGEPDDKKGSDPMSTPTTGDNPDAVQYPRKNDRGNTVWACCESAIGPTCGHRTLYYASDGDDSIPRGILPDALWRTADRHPITHGMVVWDHDMRLAVVDIMATFAGGCVAGWLDESGAPTLTWAGWFAMKRPDGTRSSTMNGERMRVRHPFTGELASARADSDTEG